MKRGFLLFFTLIFGFSIESECRDPCPSEGVERQKALYQWEDAMNWVVPFSSRTFSLMVGSRPKVFSCPLDELKEFSLNHGYFSCYKPLVGLVSDDPKDVEPIQRALSSLIRNSDQEWALLAADELISKALAYRNLRVGMKIDIPASIEGKMELVTYEVDEVLDLWHGMPAFGLLPQKNRAHPILIYRGTDFSFSSKSSWASVLSDFDLGGAGFTTFRSSQEKIRTWLEKAYKSGQKTKVMGFSLGGILAVYTALFESDWVESCVGFNAPGISKANFKIWKELSSPPPIFLYATQGDLISRFGKMVGSSFEVSDKAPMGPIEAHTKIMTAKSPILLFRIDVEKENYTRYLAHDQK